MSLVDAGFQMTLLKKVMCVADVVTDKHAHEVLQGQMSEMSFMPCLPGGHIGSQDSSGLCVLDVGHFSQGRLRRRGG